MRQRRLGMFVAQQYLQTFWHKEVELIGLSRVNTITVNSNNTTWRFMKDMIWILIMMILDLKFAVDPVIRIIALCCYCRPSIALVCCLWKRIHNSFGAPQGGCEVGCKHRIGRTKSAAQDALKFPETKLKQKIIRKESCSCCFSTWGESSSAATLPSRGPEPVEPGRLMWQDVSLREEDNILRSNYDFDNQKMP